MKDRFDSNKGSIIGVEPQATKKAAPDHLRNGSPISNDANGSTKLLFFWYFLALHHKMRDSDSSAQAAILFLDI